MAAASRPQQQHNAASAFLNLPPELRDLIYTQLLRPSSLCYSISDEHGEDSGHRRYDFRVLLALQLTSKLVQRESLSVFRNTNYFVRVSTPWPEAQQHVQHEGRVPMLCLGDAARRFENWSMGVLIEAPGFSALGLDAGDVAAEQGLDPASAAQSQNSIFIVHVRDIVDFCTMWYYSDLSHPKLNTQLALSLLLKERLPSPSRDEYSMEVDSTSLPRAVQKQFLEPFGKIKDLHSVQVHGKYDHAIYDNMMSLMRVPYDSPEHCLDQATKRREEGDAVLNKDKDYRRAIELYFDGFEHLHIRCEGRRRSIYGDAWFVKTLESGKYQGQQGHLVRLVLRVHLVAGVIHSFLGLHEWELARHWGMRSIQLMREANGDEDGENEEEPLFFPGAESVGLIYFGTAIAYRELKERDEARRYSRVAAAYLPNNEEVRNVCKELQLKRVGGYGWI